MTVVRLDRHSLFEALALITGFGGLGAMHWGRRTWRAVCNTDIHVELGDVDDTPTSTETGALP